MSELVRTAAEGREGGRNIRSKEGRQAAERASEQILKKNKQTNQEKKEKSLANVK